MTPFEPERAKQSLPPVDGNVNLAPHVVVLGAGASIAAQIAWGGTGPRLPSMDDLVDVLSVRQILESAGYDPEKQGFEEVYDRLAASTNKRDDALRQDIEHRVLGYFQTLEIPEDPTIYDYLLLSLRSKDVIATFNWDPLLVQAYLRNQSFARGHLPHMLFLHGNVLIGSCPKGRVKGRYGHSCPKCRAPLSQSKLLYPVRHKDYTADEYIKSEWETLKEALGKAYYISIFGYRAPKTDVEARQLMLEVWQRNPYQKLAEMDIIDIRPKNDLEETWDDFFVSHHYGIRNNIFDSFLFNHPRRSCDAFFAATMQLAPWHDNPFPKFRTVSDLQKWVSPLLEEERNYDAARKSFSGIPLFPNEQR